MQSTLYFLQCFVHPISVVAVVRSSALFQSQSIDSRSCRTASSIMEQAPGSFMDTASPLHAQNGGRTLCYLSSVAHDRRLGCGSKHEGVFTTKRRQGWEEWEILDTELGDGTVYIRSQWHERSYLACGDDNHEHEHGQIYISRNALGCERWRLERSPHRGGSGFFIVSAACRKQLACEDGGDHVYAANEQRGGWETWSVEVMDASSCVFATYFDGRHLSCDGAGDVALSTPLWSRLRPETARDIGVLPVGPKR